MRRTGLIATAMLSIAANAAFAQDADIQTMRRDLDHLRRDYETRIRTLERRLAAAESAARQGRADGTARRAARPRQAEEPAMEAAPPAADAQRTDAQRTDAQATADPRQPTIKRESGNNAFNPAIGVTLNGTVGTSRRDPDGYRVPGFALGPDARPSPRGFALGESEISLSANIDQVLYGALTISFARDNTFSLEEAYIQSTSLPGGVTLKGGRFKSGIGYLNEQHSHTWDFVDAPLPYLMMLNGQYGDDGAQVRWLAPVPLFLEFGAEGFRGDAYPANGAGNKGFGSFSAFVHAGDDIGDGGEGGSWRVGVSSLWTRADRLSLGTDTFHGNDHLIVVDGVYKWAPNGNFADRYVKIQGEYLLRRETGQFDGIRGTATQQGFYIQGVWQFMPRWRVGLRYDQVWGAGRSDVLAFTTWDPRGHIGTRESLMIDYSTSEFGRFRLQGNLDQSSGRSDPGVILQYTVSLGAHGAHAY